jgi:integrase
MSKIPEVFKGLDEATLVDGWHPSNIPGIEVTADLQTGDVAVRDRRISTIPQLFGKVSQPVQSNEPSTADALKDFLALPKHQDFRCYLTKSFPPLILMSTVKQIQHFIDHECGRKDKEGKPLIQPGGRHAYYRAIRCFFNWAFSPASDLDLKPSDNPITWVKAPKVPRKIMPAQTKESVEVLLSHVDNVRDQAIICLFIDSGVRLSGMANIHEPDILWDRHLIKITAKGGDEKFITFGIGTEVLIRQWLTEYHPNGGPIWGINQWGIVSMLRRLQKSSGVKCGAHSFRRGFASILRRKKIDSLDIMRLGGWKSLSMVQTYTESVNYDDSLEHYQSPIQGPADETCGLQKTGLVGRAGFEPATNGLKVHCSTN